MKIIQLIQYSRYSVKLLEKHHMKCARLHIFSVSTALNAHEKVLLFLSLEDFKFIVRELNSKVMMNKIYITREG